MWGKENCIPSWGTRIALVPVSKFAFVPSTLSNLVAICTVVATVRFFVEHNLVKMPLIWSRMETLAEFERGVAWNGKEKELNTMSEICVLPSFVSKISLDESAKALHLSFVQARTRDHAWKLWAPEVKGKVNIESSPTLGEGLYRSEILSGLDKHWHNKLITLNFLNQRRL